MFRKLIYDPQTRKYEVRFTNLKTNCYDRTINKNQNYKHETLNSKLSFALRSSLFTRILRSKLSPLPFHFSIRQNNEW